MQRANLKPLTACLLGVALAGAAAFSVQAQSPFARSDASRGVEAGYGQPTVQSASRDAQRAIRACDDNVALQCVADELTRYAETLKQIAQAREAQPSLAPHRRHSRCMRGDLLCAR